jgi:hypothetical protein
MTQEELVQFLKDNLKIEIVADNKYCDNGYDIIVRVLLGDDCISECSDYITVR